MIFGIPRPRPWCKPGAVSRVVDMPHRPAVGRDRSRFPLKIYENGEKDKINGFGSPCVGHRRGRSLDGVEAIKCSTMTGFSFFRLIFSFHTIVLSFLCI